jgi:threonine dehydrogenase-like Zn-dependent dehydrogenase
MRLEEVDRPTLLPRSAVLKIRMVQPSITEVQLALGAYRMPRWERMLTEKGPLFAFGHEFCGEVVEVAEDVQGFKVGDRVFPAKAIPCHSCALCRAGYAERCLSGPKIGVEIPGCFAEYATIPVECLMRLPDTITDSEATAMQPLTSALKFVTPAGIQIGDTVLILGQGVMGLNCAQLARAWGAGKIIVTDLRDEVLQISRRIGADAAINSSKTDALAAILEETGGIGPDVVFECAGGSTRYNLSGTETLNQAMKVVRDQGKVIQVGILDADIRVEVGPILNRGVHYMGPGHVKNRDLRYLIRLVSEKRVNPTVLLTHTLQGLEKVTEAFDITGNKAKYGAMSPAQVIV